MSRYTYPHFSTSNGHMTERVRAAYIATAVSKNLLPENAHRMAAIVSLDAPNDPTQPIQFWQLYSVLGPDRIVAIVRAFYQRVFNDEQWFRSVFERVGGVEHHVMTQAAMWVDTMGGGPVYHGGEFRLNFHHQHNALQLLNDKGAARWVHWMVETLNDASLDFTEDPRVRPALNTFLGHFMEKYAADFAFTNCGEFGDRNAPVKRRINFLNMTDDAIAALTESDLRQGLSARGVDFDTNSTKPELVNLALRL